MYRGLLLVNRFGFFNYPVVEFVFKTIFSISVTTEELLLRNLFSRFRLLLRNDYRCWHFDFFFTKKVKFDECFWRILAYCFTNCSTFTQSPARHSTK